MMSSDMCRLCLEKEFLISIFKIRNSIRISSAITNLSQVAIHPDDGLPNKICAKCIEKLDTCTEFIEMCQNTDTKLRLANDTNSQKNSETDDEHYPLIIEETHTLNSNESDNQDSEVNNTITKVELKEIEILKIKKQSIKQQCFTCGKVMSSRFRLKTHLRTHTGERPFSCHHCKKSFSLEQSLKIHMRVHTGEKPHQCSICGESFAQTAGLATHKRKHTGQTPYQCVLCPRSFRTNAHLQYHVRRHTGEKNFECDTCNKAFITRSSLKQHLLTHTGDRPHICSICGKKMARASHVKRHMQQVHKKKEILNIQEKSEENELVQEKVFKSAELKA